MLGKISPSLAVAILGLHKKISPRCVFDYFVYGKEIFVSSENLQIGREELIDLGREELQELEGLAILKPIFTFQADKRWEEEIEESYKLRAVWELRANPGKNRVLYIVYKYPSIVEFYHVLRDSEELATMENYINDWYKKYILTKTPPPITDWKVIDFDEITGIYNLTEEEEAKAVILREKSRELKNNKAEVENLKGQLLNSLLTRGACRAGNSVQVLDGNMMQIMQIKEGKTGNKILKLED